MAELCPSSPDLLLFIQDEINRCGYYCYTKNDSLKTKNGLLPVIESIITKKEKPDNYAAFLFAASILEGDFNHNASRAKKYIKMAGKSADNPSLAEHIRAYRIKLDWSGGNLSNMPSDIKWLGSKIEPTSDECNYWNRILGNLVYSKAVPSLLRKGDTTRAIQLAGFADYLLVNQQDKPFLSYHWTNAGYVTKEAYSLYDERTNPLVFNEIDYGCYTFQLMNSLSPEAVIDYKRNLRSKSEIDRYLNAVARTDDDYLNELIGTLYLREADYENAEKYLSMVSPAYQYKLNTYVYLKRDPYTDRSDYQMKDYFENIYWGSNPEPTLSYMEDVKLNFARMMRKWKHDMAHLPDPNRRGLAQIRYAIGYINSFTVCWALTSYYKGWPDTRFDCTGCNGFICGLEDEDPDEITMKNVKLEYDRLVAGAMDMFDNPEYAAYANFLLHNYLTIAKHYGDTKIAKMLRAQCDSYGDWVAMTGGGSDI